MYEEKFVVDNAEGLHARPASKLVELAGKYESKVEVVYKGKAVNAKSILRASTRAPRSCCASRGRTSRLRARSCPST